MKTFTSHILYKLEDVAPLFLTQMLHLLWQFYDHPVPSLLQCQGSADLKGKEAEVYRRVSVTEQTPRGIQPTHIIWFLSHYEQSSGKKKIKKCFACVSLGWSKGKYLILIRVLTYIVSKNHFLKITNLQSHIFIQSMIINRCWNDFVKDR